MNRILLLFILTCLGRVGAEVRLCGLQTEDLNLKPENNPYIIAGDVVIGKRTLWNVNPGVVFKIDRAAACTSETMPLEPEEKNGLFAIYVKGSFQCAGSSDKRIVFEPLHSEKNRVVWYGLVFDGVKEGNVRLQYVDISGAFCAVTLRDCSPVIRNCVLRKNQTAISCGPGCQSEIFNNNIVYNFSTGVLNRQSAPKLYNNLIAWNLIGIWSDVLSDLDIAYNDFWANHDMNFMECPPKYGMICQVNGRKDSCDYKSNLFIDPVLAGSPAYTDSLRKDVHVPTDTAKADVADRRLSRRLVETRPITPQHQEAPESTPHQPWQLSRYSRLINAGNPKKGYYDTDGTPNDIGVTGASEYISK